jgi:hypothetical protein
MPNGYSNDLRDHVLAYYENGHTPWDDSLDSADKALTGTLELVRDLK